MDIKYLRQVLIYVLSTVISVGVSVYIVYHLFYGLTQKMETEPARITKLTETVEATAYLFRDEICLPASSTASRIPAVSDGERVGVGDVVSRQYDVTAPDTVARIAGLQTQLEVIDQMRRQQISVRDTASVEGEIYDILAEIASLGTSGECGGALSLRASLSAVMNRRQLLTGSSSDIESMYSALNAEKNACISQLGTCRAEQTTPYSGYYYAQCDGYENSFTVKRALSMTAAEFDALTETQPQQKNCAGKIARDTTWYIACRIPAEKAADFTKGTSYIITFPYSAGRELTMQLQRTEADDNGLLLVFSTDELPADFPFTRAQNILIGTKDYEGIRLPLSALRMSGGTTGVYILDGGVVRFRAVRILFEGEDFFLVDAEPDTDPPAGMLWLRRNDFVITRGRGLTDGRILA